MEASRRAVVRALLPPVLATIVVAMSAAFVLPAHRSAAPLFLAARALLFLWAGVRAVTVAGRGAGAAALFGPVLFFVDEVLLKGSCYLARAACTFGEDRRAMLVASAGVLGSWALWVALPAAISWAGGALASRRARERAAAA